MYKEYFSFTEPPFSIAPDPRYLYMSGQHREALAHLLYGVESDGGFVLLTGDVGTGKTTVCRCLLENLPEHCDVAFIYNPKLDVQELLATICEEFGIKVHGNNPSNKIYVLHINAFLLDGHAKGRKAVLIIDEAQNLAVDVLEQLRLLTNLETHERKLLQIILLGQPELQELLARKDLRQLAQRIVARYHLQPLSRAETYAYVNHRLTVAGSGRQLFPPSTLRRIYRLSSGVPRVINLLCDRALLGAYVQGKDKVDGRTLAKAAHEVFGEPDQRTGRLQRLGLGLAGLAALGGTVLAIAYYQHGSSIEQTGVAPVLKLPAVSVSAPPEVAPFDTLARPEGVSKSNSESAALVALFHLWGLNYKASGEALCQQAEGQGLRCLSDSGGLHELRRLNLPVVLQFSDGKGSDFHAALTALDNRAATLAMADGSVKEINVAALARYWNGAYTLLWRAPPEYDGALQEGSSGTTVLWLRQQLSRVAGQKATDSVPRFGRELARQVREFQASEGLQPDGIAGPLTLIRLMARTDSDAPRLIK